MIPSLAKFSVEAGPTKQDIDRDNINSVKTKSQEFVCVECNKEYKIYIVYSILYIFEKVRKYINLYRNKLVYIIW